MLTQLADTLSLLLLLSLELRSGQYQMYILHYRKQSLQQLLLNCVFGL
jgi:hypothetical protein